MPQHIVGTAILIGQNYETPRDNLGLVPGKFVTMHTRWVLILFMMLPIAAGSDLPEAIGAPPDSTTDQILLTLEYGSVVERERAARQLGRQSDSVGVAVPALLKTMRNDGDKSVITSARSALVNIGQPAVPHILAAMDDWPSDRLRELVVILAVMGADAESAFPKLQALLKSRDAGLRRSVQFALKNIQPVNAKATTQKLTVALNKTNGAKPKRTTAHPDSAEPRYLPLTIVEFDDSTSDGEENTPTPRSQIQQVAGEINPAPVVIAVPRTTPGRATHSAIAEEPARLQGHRVISPITEKTLLKTRTQPHQPLQNASVAAGSNGDLWFRDVRSKAATLLATTTRSVTENRRIWVDTARWAGLAYAGWLLMFLIVPCLYVEAETHLRRPRRSLLEKLILVWLPLLRMILLLPLLCRSRYATRAWINSRSAEMANQFWTRRGIGLHARYASVPVLINSRIQQQLKARDLRPLGRHAGMIVHIAGASGMGKAATAVEIARQAVSGVLPGGRLLPVFLRPGIPVAAEVRRQVLHLLSIDEDHVCRYSALLQQCEARYILPIIEIPVNSDTTILLEEVRSLLGRTTVVLVSKDKHLPAVQVGLRLEPQIPEGELLRAFVNDYFACRMSATSIPDSDQEDLCEHWQNLRISGPRSLVFLTMFLDDFLRHSKHDSWQPTQTIVELLHRHIDGLLAHAAGSGFTPDELRRDIAELAKMSTAKAFRSQPVRYDAALKRMGGWNAAHRLRLLEDRLQLVEIERGENGVVRFRNELIAVQLSAAERQASLDLSAPRWNSYLQQLRFAVRDAKSDVELYALALYNCCAASQNVRPDFVLGELGELAGLDAKQVQHDILEQQTTASVSLLKSDDQQTRLDALAELRRLANRSERALSVLVDVRCDVEVDSNTRAATADELAELGPRALDQLCARLKAADSRAKVVLIDQLRRIGPAAQSAVPLLLQQLTESVDLVRASTILAIATIAPNELTPLNELLRANSPVVRAACVEAFGTLGESAEDMVETITTLLDDDSVQVRLAAVIALGKIGLASVDVVTGMIKAMVADEEEVRRAASMSLTLLRGTPDTPGNLGFERDRGRAGLALTAMARAA